MRRPRNVKQTQTELFAELRPVSSPIPLDLPAERQAELQRLVGELLLTVARPNAKVPRGGECDE
jgi:hypothetical protein